MCGQLGPSLRTSLDLRAAVWDLCGAADRHLRLYSEGLTQAELRARFRERTRGAEGGILKALAKRGRVSESPTRERIPGRRAAARRYRAKG